MNNPATPSPPSPPPFGLYLHVPFCLRKCPYCAFYSGLRPTPDAIHAYLVGLQTDLDDRRHRFPDLFPLAPTTLYIGGGTPSALPPRALSRLLDWLQTAFDLTRLREYTVEINPVTFTPEKARILRDHAVTRLSFGVQSFDPAALALLGRLHTPSQARDAILLAHTLGFPRLSLDLIYGLPTLPRPLHAFHADLLAAAALPVTHLSAYALEIEPGTPFARRAAADPAFAPSDTLQRRLYDHLLAVAPALGWPPYELSNFAAPGHESLHNLHYWTGAPYLGLGPAAHSHLHGVRYGNSATFPAWTETLVDALPPLAKARETLVFGLRRTAGWTAETFADATGGLHWRALGRNAELDALVADRLLLETPTTLRLPPTAYFISDTIFSSLI